MPVVIQDFEAIGDPAPAGESGTPATPAPQKLQPATLRAPLRRIEARERRLRAH